MRLTWVDMGVDIRAVGGAGQDDEECKGYLSAALALGDLAI